MHVPGGEHQFQFSCPLLKKNRWINFALLFVVVVFVYNSKKTARSLSNCHIVRKALVSQYGFYLNHLCRIMHLL